MKLLGHEAALAIFMELEKLESMPRSFLEAEYELLGMPVEKLQEKEIIRRLRQSLIWSQLETDQLLEECETRELPLGNGRCLLEGSVKSTWNMMLRRGHN